MGKKISIYTIAQEVGVSTATVSKVINNKGYVAQETKDRVLEAIRTHEYIPAQKKLSRNAIGLVCFHYPQIFASSFSCRLMTGISQQAFDGGNELLLINGETLARMSPQELFRYQFSHATLGYLLLNADADTPLLPLMKQAGISFINLANDAEDKTVHYISSNNYESTREIMDYMIGMGHRRIAILGPLMNCIASHQERLQGYLHALREHGIPEDPQLIADIPAQEPAVVSNALKRLLGRSIPPTAIFFINTECGNQIYAELTKMNCRIPQDISLGGCYEMAENPWIKANFTSFSQPVEEIGRIAVQKLLELERNPEEQIQIRVTNALSFGETVQRIS